MKTATLVESPPEEQQAIVLHQPQSASLFRTDDPVEVVQKASAVASALRDVISKQGLISNIQGKQYPKCEAWTLCGTMLGIFPVLCWTRPLEDGWEARVEAKTRDGAVVGAAEAECLRTERNWATRDDFALRSMAQTRATAKALRMPLGFIMTLAGYEPTPMEEMVHDPGAIRRSANPPEDSGYLPSDDGDLQRNLGASGDTRIDGRNADKPKATNTVRTEAAASTRTANINPPPTQQHKDKMLAELVAHYGDQKALHDYAVKAAILLHTETLLDWPLRFVPNTQTQMGLLGAAIDDFFEGRDAVRPFVNSEPGSKPQTPEKAKSAPKQANVASVGTVAKDDGGWRAFPCPFGKNSGIPLGKLSEKSLQWYVENFVVTFEYNGKPKRPETIAKDKAFKAALDAAKSELGIEGHSGTE